MDAPLRIALIGAGNMGRQHYHRLQRIAGARLCAVADPQGQAFAADAGVPWFGDHRRLLEEARPQAAIVANPNNLHVATALDCLAAGVPLLLEKPVGVQLDEVSELVAVARRSGVPLLVGHHRRHNPLVVRARQLIAEGALGRLLSVTALWQLKKPDSYFEVAWRREPGAGMLLTNLIHDLDLLRHLCGEVREVQALAGNAIRGLPNEDNVAVLLRFANGALGSLTGCDAAAAPWSWELAAGENPVYPRQAEQPCYLLAGTEGALSLPQLRRWRYAEARQGWHDPLAASVEAVAAGDPLQRQLEHFVRVARGEEAPLMDATDAARTLALVEAVRETGVRTLDVEILRLRPDTRVGEFAEVLEVGAEFGARYVLVAGNDDDERRSADNFAALCDLARPLGLDPHLEFMPWTGIRDLRQAARVVEAAARDNAGLLLDAFHFDRSASSLEDLRAIPPARLGYAQLCDVVGARPASMDEILRQAREERRFPGDGGLDLLALLRALPENLPLSLEVPALDLLARGVSGAERARLAIERTRALLARL